MVRPYLPTFILYIVHQSSYSARFISRLLLESVDPLREEDSQVLCFTVVVKLKKQYKMISSVFSCQLVRDWTASRDALIRTLLSAFFWLCGRLSPKPVLEYFFIGTAKQLIWFTVNLNLPLISTPPVVWPQRGASFCFLPAVQGQHKRNDIKKTPGQLIFQLAKLFLSLYT